LSARHAHRGARPFVVAVVLLTWLGAAPVAGATARPAGADGPTAKASITFDVATGEVLAADNARVRLRVASTFKVLTALVVRANVDLDTEVPITARAEAVPPLKLSMRPGSKWNANGLLHAMLIASINDAAVALAEQAGGGSLAGFDRALAAESRRLGLADHPILNDPAGLDDDSSVDGGNLISARDLAIATRAFLSDPLLAGIVRLPEYHFAGGDGKPHVVYNHNAFLTIYPGAIGVKTGYTERSGHSLIAAATRNGRTLAVVVIGTSDPVGVATAALDKAFAGLPTRGASVAGTGDTLGAVGLAAAVLPNDDATARPVSFRAQVPPLRSSSDAWLLVVGFVAIVVVMVAGRVLRRERPAVRAEPRPARNAG
jgi:D-alanyl-D-alanine carboxypeptidase